MPRASVDCVAAVLDDVAPLWTLAAPGARTFGDAVRQALDFATPTQQIIDQLLKGRAVRSIGDVAPAVKGVHAQ